MKLIITAAVVAASLSLVGQAGVRAGGQAQCGTKQGAGAKTPEAAQANIEAKKKAEGEKYRTTEANAANQACPESASPPGPPSKK